MALSVVAAAILVTSCVPRGAVVNVGGADVGVAERSEAIGAKSGLPDTAASAAGVIVDRAPHATRTPMSLAAPATEALPTATPTPERRPRIHLMSRAWRMCLTRRSQLTSHRHP